ncbi:MAG: DegV family protein [Oscillospiraceae bacterium]|jgi:DegV family protein with EDD domain|nr:DegV family protein [Oscillospiraceae bacterium]
MKKIAIITDSNSGITRAEAARLGVHVLPMPFLMDGGMYFEDVNLTQEDFYKKLIEGADISTSQPSVESVTGLWNDLLKQHDEIVHIPMSGGLSASCETAEMLAQDYGGKVQVVNNQRISVTQRQSALDALALADAGWDAARIKAKLEDEKFNSSIYIMLDTLKYLKKGGRVTPAAAMVGAVLNIKPVLQIQGDKLDAFAKARGAKQALSILIDAMRHDFQTRFAAFSDPQHMWLQIAYTYDHDAAREFKAQAEAAFPGFDIHMDPLSLSVSCHIGPGAIAIACSKKVL